ncbi:MAG: pyrimidine 5'-nucleotidase [Betaproteobacteria bacterium]|nr:pyrimidine 5'-nucleotidase [Betaproteobacteria bacterium]
MKRQALSRLKRRDGPVWLLDLDNTLHDAGTHIMPRVNRAMTQWVAKHLAVDEDEASRLRVAYWKRYGATLLGMIEHHAINPHAFLQDTHPLPDLLAKLGPHKALQERHAALDALVEQVICIEDMCFAGRFRPKPSVAMLKMICARLGVSSRQCLLVEDSVENLRAARRLGMQTILVLEHGWRGRPRSAHAGHARVLTHQVHSARQLTRLLSVRSSPAVKAER